MLRNRRTGETFKVTPSGLVRKNLFSKTVKAKKTEVDLLKEFLEDFKTRLPKDLSEHERAEIIKKVEEICFKHSDDILKHSKLLVQMLEEETSKEEKKSQSSVLPHLGKLESAALLPLFLATGLLSPAAAAATTASMASSYVINDGIPAGGLDMCKGIIFGCAQGYLTDGIRPWNASLPQFNRIVQQAGSGEAAVSDREALRKCMDLKKTGQTVIDALNSNFETITNSSIPEAVCSSESNIWHNWQLTSQVRNIPAAACPAYQNLFPATSQSCMSWTKSAAEWITIVGGIAGAVAGIALCVGAYRYCKRKCEDQKFMNERLPLNA